MTRKLFVPKKEYALIDNGRVAYVSPSNIALVKYWGKYAEQLPQNPSISFTLSTCQTKTTVAFKKSHSLFFEVLLDGIREPSFEPKIATFFERIVQYVPFINEYSFTIETSNTFPHSSGIASSASGMSALALCLVAIEKQLNSELSEEYCAQKASFLARLGSGSACRSIKGPLVVWGEHQEISNSSNLYGTPFLGEVHQIFQEYQDTILLVDKGEKQVSSTVGHGLMHGHAFAKARFSQAHKNLSSLISVFKTGAIDLFIKIVESEALTLHAMMLTSHPYFILMKPNTLQIINAIWKYREETGSKVCFTLDAGANVHVLYPRQERELVQHFIAGELAQFCQNKQYINDYAGFGAKKL